MDHEEDDRVMMTNNNPKHNAEEEGDGDELPFAIVPPSVYSSTSTKGSLDSNICHSYPQNSGSNSALSSHLQKSGDSISSNGESEVFNMNSSLPFQRVENSTQSSFLTDQNHLRSSINEVQSSWLPPSNQSLISSSISSSNHFQHSLVDDTLGFTQLMQRADDTQSASLSDGTRQQQQMQHLQRTNNNYNSSNLPNIAEEQAPQMTLSNTDESIDQHFEGHPLGTTITPPLSTIRKTQAQIISNDSFCVSTHLPSVTTRDAIDIVSNPDLLPIWCEPLSSTGLLFETDNTNTTTPIDDNLILQGSASINPAPNRQYDGEWMHGSSSSLTLPPSSTSIFINFINTAKEYFGFPSCGNITMFIERSRGQVCVTIGPFPNRISTVLFGGSGIVLVNTIRVIENKNDGGVDLISTVQLTNETSSSPNHGFENQYDNYNEGGTCFMDDLLDIVKGLVGVSSSSSSSSCCSSCPNFYDYYSLDGFMRQHFQSIQKLSILIEEGGDVNACCFNSRDYATREDWERDHKRVPLLS